MQMTAARKSHDLVVFGASSFVGQILVRYLYQEFGLGGRLRWAIAGRSQAKLEDLRAALGRGAAKLPILVADAGDDAALRAMCTETHAIASTVGPYALYGEPLVRACVEAGTDYCDLTGEPHWIRRMLQKYQAAARKSGARIVHCCGFDSIPSDLGVHFLQREARRRFGGPCNRVKMRVKVMSGGFSGGTVASAINAFKEASADPKLRKELANPYSLCPQGFGSKTRQPSVRFVEYDADFDSWVAPFVMAAPNVRIVHRTNALTGGAYGADFRYDEAMLGGSGLRGRAAATAIAAGLGGFVLAASIPPIRAALERFVLPAPGAGPSPEAQRKGFYDLRFLGQTADGRSIRVKVTGQGDPGYGSTSKILGQVAKMLALDLPKSRVEGGFWTPATIFGDTLIDRLEKHADLHFEVLED
jgi:short subunit dehydrogenase-like uncharacterized protein